MKRLAGGVWPAVALFSVSAPPAAAAAAPPSLVRCEGTRLSMGCVYSIVVYGPDPRLLPPIVEAALDEVDRIDRLMSHYKAESPLSRLNRTAAQGPVSVEPELLDFISVCLDYSRDSDGAFDITVGPLMKAWGFFRGEGRIPGDLEIVGLQNRVGYRHVIVDAEARTIRFDQTGVELDLGGIAKGYAVDRAVGLLEESGIGSALVSAGGSTIYALGAPPGSKGWEVSVRDPIDGRRTAHRVLLRDRALSISGTAEKSFEVEGVTYSHIMDPRSGRPVQGVLSVAVLTKTGTAGDALDDAFFVEGAVKTREHLKRLAATEAYFFLPGRRGRWQMIRVRG